MNAKIDLNPEHRAIVLDILRAHLPAHAKVWVAGSRATGKARRTSDLDLVFDVGQRLSSNLEYALHDAFSDSDLPWRVDVIDAQRMQGDSLKYFESVRLGLDWRGAEDGE